MDDQESLIRIHIDAGEAADASAHERLSIQLRQELCELDGVETIELGVSTDSYTRGSKSSLGGTDFTSLVITLAGAGGVLTSLVGVLQNWLKRGEQRSVTLKIGPDTLILKGYSAKDQENVVKEFLDHHKL